MFANDKISNWFGSRDGVDAVVIGNDVCLGIEGKGASHSNELGPVHMVAEVGRGRKDGV